MLGETCHLNDDNALPYLQATVAELLSLWMVPISSSLLLVWCIRRQAFNMRGTVLLAIWAWSLFRFSAPSLGCPSAGIQHAWDDCVFCKRLALLVIIADLLLALMF